MVSCVIHLLGTEAGKIKHRLKNHQRSWFHWASTPCAVRKILGGPEEKVHKPHLAVGCSSGPWQCSFTQGVMQCAIKVSFMQLHVLSMLPSAPQFLDVFCASEQYSSALRGQKASTEHFFPDGEKDLTVSLGKNIVKLTLQRVKMLSISILGNFSVKHASKFIIGYVGHL